MQFLMQPNLGLGTIDPVTFPTCRGLGMLQRNSVKQQHSEKQRTTFTQVNNGIICIYLVLPTIVGQRLITEKRIADARRFTERSKRRHRAWNVDADSLNTAVMRPGCSARCIYQHCGLIIINRIRAMTEEVTPKPATHPRKQTFFFFFCEKHTINSHLNSGFTRVY